MYIRPEKRKFHFVYRIERHDGKFYIGVHSTDDLNDGYFGSGKLLFHSIKKHGKENHILKIVEHVASRSAAFQLEAQMVSEETLKDPKCMNMRPGGLYATMTEEIKRKISATKSGVKMSDAARLAMSNAGKGKRKSDAHRAAISAAHKGKVGHSPSANTREKLRHARLGTTLSEETCKRMSESMRGLKRKVLICPHCGKSGGDSNMRRYHFDKCKSIT